MKVFNITDVPTSALENNGMVSVAIKVGDIIIPVGQSRELRGTAREISELSSYLRCGAAVRDQLPAAYAQKKGVDLQGNPPATDEPDEEE